MSNLLEPLLVSGGRQVNSCGALCFHTRFAMYSRRDKPSRFLPSPLAGLTRQWHARGGESKRAGLFDLFLANGSLSWGRGNRSIGPIRARSASGQGSLFACPTHVSWNSYCTPAGNVQKRSSLLKKQHTHVFRGLQGKLEKSCNCDQPL